MKTLAALALAAALALSACDAGETFPTDGNPTDMRGAAGAAGKSGAGGAGGAGGAVYTPDPAARCVDPGTTTQLVICDADGLRTPMFNDAGTQCYYCAGWAVPDAGCAIHVPAAISGGQVIHPEHDIFCAPNTCDPSVCHPKS